MQYVLRQKAISLGINFIITDGEGREVFVASSDPGRIGNNLTFQDPAGNEVLRVEQGAWNPTYELWRGGKMLAAVKRVPRTFAGHRFTIDTHGADDLGAEGDFFDRKYTMNRGERAISRISKRWFRRSDTWDIEIDDAETDQSLVLAAWVVIEMACWNYHNN